MWRHSVLLHFYQIHRKSWIHIAHTWQTLVGTLNYKHSLKDHLVRNWKVCRLSKSLLSHPGSLPILGSPWLWQAFLPAKTGIVERNGDASIDLSWLPHNNVQTAAGYTELIQLFDWKKMLGIKQITTLKENARIILIDQIFGQIYHWILPRFSAWFS